jgi:hypothetical protein
MNKLKEIVEKFDDDKIEEFLATIDMKEIIEESSKGINSPTDDGPPTFYRTFSGYKSKSKSWIKQLQTELGWEVINYILSKGAEDPEFDFTMSYRAVPAISYGEKKKYKNHIDFSSALLKAEDLEFQVSIVGNLITARKFKTAFKNIERLKKKIKNMRRAGLESPRREFSVENIAFKILRRDGTLETLSDLKTKLYDTMLSVSEE